MVTVVSDELSSVDLSSLAQQTTVNSILTALSATLNVDDAAAQVILGNLLTRLGQPLLIDDTTPISTTASVDTTGLATDAQLASILTKLNAAFSDKGQLAPASSVSVVQATGTSLAVTGDLNLSVDGGVPAQGSVSVTTAGTAVPLPAKALKNGVLLQWHPSNTGRIYYGDSAVANSLAGPFLDDTVDAIVWKVNDLSDLSINADTSGDSVLWFAS